MDLNEKEIEQANRTIDLSGFKMQDELNPKIWDKEQNMKSDVRKTLLKIADDYFESLEIPGVDIEDVTMTGSLANYNWSKYSDIDLHILIDYEEMPMDETLIEDFLKSKSSNWNKEHDIKVYGFDVELYVQDIEEEHTSTGVYSILKNEWVIKPEKKKISINDKTIKNKANRLMDMIDDIYEDMEEEEDYDKIVNLVQKIQDKIKKMRQCGLDEGGEWSVENIVFKVLRRNGMLDRLGDIKTVAYDKSMTLESTFLNESEDFDWAKDIKEEDFWERDTYYIFSDDEFDFEGPGIIRSDSFEKHLKMGPGSSSIIIGEPTILHEFSLVYPKGIPWEIISQIMNKIGLNYMDSLTMGGMISRRIKDEYVYDKDMGTFR